MSAPDGREAHEVEPSLLTDDELFEFFEPEVEAEPVSYSGTDFDVEGLVRRLERGDIVIPNFGHGDPSLELAGFQRGFVWRKPQMDKFIESLLLGFPIPGLMLVQQMDRRLLVLDGQQRLTTLGAFYSGIHDGKEFRLENVAYQFQGLTYRTLDAEQRRRLDNTFIQATIVRTDGSRESLESIYQIFERLNSGGTQLTAHEIRIALYPGELADFVTALNEWEGWRALYGQRSPRVRDHELVLRILALYTRNAEYRRPLKTFLNDFIAEHRDMRRLPADSLRKLFETATNALASADARAHLRRSGQRVNAALLEAVVVAAMQRAARQKDMSSSKIEAALTDLSSRDDLEAAISGSTATEENVKTRLDLATAAFDKPE